MNAEFIPHECEEKVYSKLRNITIEDFITEGRTESEARYKLIEQIIGHPTMIELRGNDDSTNCKILERAVHNTLWGRTVYTFTEYGHQAPFRTLCLRMMKARAMYARCQHKTE